MTTTALALSQSDKLECRAWIAHHSKSFYLSSLLLPARVREAAWALYAFCRRADDAVDEDDSETQGMARVEGLRRRLDSVYRGEAQSNPIDRAFAQVAERYTIPRGLPEELLLGMEMDATGARYDSDEDLLLYCFRVAAVVGLMMTCVMGAEQPELAYLRASDLGVAMQLTNIARDVGEDARRGRVYLPKSLCDEVGLDQSSILRANAATPEIRRAVEKLLARAEAHYRAADLGVPLLPPSCRIAIASSRRIYSAIGREVAQNGYDSITTRAHVSLGGKLWLVAGALVTPFIGAGRSTQESVGPADATLKHWITRAGLLT